MKSQRYRAYNNRYWKRLRQKIHAPYKYYKNGLKYGDHLLPSGYLVSRTYGALHKCWVGFVITKKKYEWVMIEIYAKLIKKLERELGIEVTDFSDWGI